jgi:hypothetical protein
VNRADVQGLLFSGYAAQPASALLLVRFAQGRPNAWLRRILWQVSSGAASERRDPFRLNLAFSYRGLEKLGLPAATLAGFSREFRQGMAHPERSAALGDRGPCEPARWDFSDRGSRGVDGVVLVYAPGPSELLEKLAELEQGIRHFELESECLPTHLSSDGRQHFGFTRAVSEPNVRGFGRRDLPRPRIARGEFLLGYADGVGDRERGVVAPLRRTTRQPPAMAGSVRRVDFGLNGSYLVIRKLELEPSGLACPPEAQVRRANPRHALTGDERESNRHLLLRRGRWYGPGAESESEAAPGGLLFVALNADLARQFEHVQGQCLAQSAPLGWRGEADPPSLAALPPWPRVRGGLYGFLPGVRALGYLADLDEPRALP